MSEQEPNLIESFLIPKATGVSPLTFQLPGDDGRGSVTVLCGENGTGKSFILRALKGVATAKQSSKSFPGFKLKTTGQGPVNIVRPHHHKERMTSLGIMGEVQAGKKVKLGDEYLRLKIGLFALLMPPILEAIGVQDDFQTEKWLDDENYRQSVHQLVVDEEEALFMLDVARYDFLRVFLKVTNAALGFRKHEKGIELVLVWGNGVVAPYPDWSDGQKSLFTIMTEIAVDQPDVCAYDEIENFFHPRYISDVLEFLKDHVPQTILASHHPHMIFGRAVDDVYFVELEHVRDPVGPTRIVRRPSQPIPKRKFTRLKDDFRRLAYTYKLFDIADARLLSQAASSTELTSSTVKLAMATAFECAAAPARNSPYPDRQSAQIGAFLEKYFSGMTALEVVDWGAGLGRTVKEIRKTQSADRIRWTLFEPNEETGAKLKALHDEDPHVTITESVEDLSTMSADVVLLTNVLHVLRPNEIAQAMSAIHAILTEREGVLIASEIFPLLMPEQDAVPVPAHHLASFLRTIGFGVAQVNFEVAGCSAYCLAAQVKSGTAPESKFIETEAVKMWRQINSEFVANYADAGPMTSLEDQKRLLNWVFGIARIQHVLQP